MIIKNNSITVTSPLLPDLDDFIPMLKDIWDRKWLTNNGYYHKQLEAALADYLGVKYLSLFTNGTLPLITALQAMRITGEVITTPYSFVATTHSIWWNGLKPVFVDVDEETGNIDPEKIEAAITPHTTAIMPVHVYGTPCDTKRIQEIANIYGLKVIYDAAHAFGVEVNGESILKAGDMSTLSFHATKVFNTIEGGALIFDNDELSYKLKALKNFGITPDKEEVRFLGKNGKMNEFEAAMGLCNLNNLDNVIHERSLIYNHYLECLEDLEDAGELKVIRPKANVDYNYAYFTIKLNGVEERDYLMDKLAEYNVFAKKYFYPPCNEFPAYDFERNTPIAKGVSDSILSLPMYYGLSLDDVGQICEIIKLELKNYE
jgi:dTDP-4-amino-4,6-dideoxygalactose transaminase